LEASQMTLPLPPGGTKSELPKAHSAGFAQIIGDFFNSIGQKRRFWLD